MSETGKWTLGVLVAIAAACLGFVVERIVDTRLDVSALSERTRVLEVERNILPRLRDLEETVRRLEDEPR